MRRFSFDKMPLIFSTPRYFDHIPLLAVALVTLGGLLSAPSMRKARATLFLLLLDTGTVSIGFVMVTAEACDTLKENLGTKHTMLYIVEY